MEPFALFDKSFLQCLNEREATLFDLFFCTHITPIFFAETLADLHGGQRGGDTPDEIVARLAAKTPVAHSYVAPDHFALARASLLGVRLDLQPHPLMGAGRTAMVNGKKVMVLDASDVEVALDRWRAGDFSGLERELAAAWRAALAAAPRIRPDVFDATGTKLRLKDMAAVKEMTDALLDRSERRWVVLQATMSAMNSPPAEQRAIHERWRKEGRPLLRDFAPYAAHAFSVSVFHQLALATGKIDAGRPSNHLDMMYLPYLPFVDIFVSCDRLHREVTAHFLRPNQRFLWGPDLKVALQELASYYDGRPDLTKLGLYKLCNFPPLDVDLAFCRLYDAIAPSWRKEADRPIEMSPDQSKELFADRDAINKARANGAFLRRRFDHDPDIVQLERRIPRKRGGWPMFPPDFD